MLPQEHNLAQLYSGQHRFLPDSYIEQAGLELLCILTKTTNLAQLYSGQCRSLPDSYIEQAGL
ncbi:hypothetical protein DPMN_015618 [Dreissena polymorpha]|uniref:Uncharacterized protein n=1 Tax=Dreissena polymorpha TaxID=45954 RepID=A0A9D4ND54_DREPO|nr:hypothetical protein DPMN_015618 [Dreissena polymorpha]